MIQKDKKNILIVHYSQSGQLDEVVKNFAQPLIDSPEINVVFEAIKPIEDFPFPWPFLRFFDTFPEAVFLDPPPIQPSTLSGEEDFDLIILAYQVWFLSPSLPTTAFLQSDVAAKLLKNKPVVTLIACRNMWLMAQEAVKTLLNDLDAKLVGNVALTDEAGSAGSFLATPIWVLSGKKGPHLGGLIPKAGVSPAAIEAASRFGQRILDTFSAGQAINDTLLQNLGAVDINENLISSEKTAKRGFRLWGALLRKLGPQGSFARKPLLIIYFLFLLTFILTFIPLSVLIKKILSPLTKKYTAEQKTYFGKPSGP